MATDHTQDEVRRRNLELTEQGIRRKNLSSAEAAVYLNISLRTLRNWVSDGRIRAKRCGPKLLRFDIDELDRVLSNI